MVNSFILLREGIWLCIKNTLAHFLRGCYNLSEWQTVIDKGRSPWRHLSESEIWVQASAWHGSPLVYSLPLDLCSLGLTQNAG